MNIRYVVELSDEELKMAVGMRRVKRHILLPQAIATRR